jgi:hypothetical protein
MDAMEREAIDETAERRDQHVEVRELGIGRVRAAKRDARSSEYRHPPDRS